MGLENDVGYDDDDKKKCFYTEKAEDKTEKFNIKLKISRNIENIFRNKGAILYVM